MPIVKVIMIGDVTGEPGLLALEERLPRLIDEKEPDFIIVNGENSAEGFGVTQKTLERILALGVDIVSSGNHVWEKRDFWPVLDSEERILRPANYPAGSPGKGWAIIQKELNGKTKSFLAINLQGRELMNPIDCPFRTFDEIEARLKDRSEKPIIMVDFHAESTREKEAFGFYADGRASVVAGTHTHVQSADEKILPKGSAYISDLGMTGIKNAVIGMDTKTCVRRAQNQVLYRMETTAEGEKSVQGIIVEIEDESGKAVSIKRLL